MRIVGQARRLLPGSEEKLDGNAYLGLTALMGLVGWGPTAYVVHFMAAPPKGVVTLREVGPWVERVTRYSWELVWLWAALTVGLLAVSALRVERGAVLSIPSLLWAGGMVLALAVTAASLHFQVPWLTWMPWLALFAVGYLATGVLVERGGIYLLAGGISGLLALNGAYGVLTSTGCLVITLNPAVETPLAGAVLFPMPLTYVVIGALHVLPVGIDALVGGRGMTEAGIPRVRADRLADEDRAGGVVPD